MPGRDVLGVLGCLALISVTPPSSFSHLCPFSTSFREIAPSLLVRCTTAKELKIFSQKYDDDLFSVKDQEFSVQDLEWTPHGAP